jgi:ElaB/YqjD/DUF883 family membrane-anchored ribosome-binding protein
MDYNPNNPSEPLSDQQKFGQGGTFASGGAGMSRDPADRSSEAFGDASGTLGRESLGGGQSKLSQTASDVADQARDKLGSAKEKASNLKSTLADKIEAGADKLRSKSQSDVATGQQDNVSRVGDKLASGMQSTADWLRDADLQSIQHGIETQVRENPGRTLLIALGIGYLVGRAVRGGSNQG